MTRAEFVRFYAKNCGQSDKWAELGIIDFGGGVIRVALPCACDNEVCSGWVMVTGETLLHHLEFDAPEPLRTAYRETLTKVEATQKAQS